MDDEREVKCSLCGCVCKFDGRDEWKLIGGLTAWLGLFLLPLGTMTLLDWLIHWDQSFGILVGLIVWAVLTTFFSAVTRGGSVVIAGRASRQSGQDQKMTRVAHLSVGAVKLRGTVPAAHRLTDRIISEAANVTISVSNRTTKRVQADVRSKRMTFLSVEKIPCRPSSPV